MRNFVAVILLVLGGVRGAQARETVTVGSYNIENAFDVFDDPYTNDEEMKPKSRESLEAVAAGIRAMDADVLGVVEVENEHVLRAVVDEFLADMGYRHVAVLPTNSDRGINLGVVSRLPIVRLAMYRYQDLTLPGDDRTWHFARGLLQVTVDVPDERHLEVFVAHLKSEHDSYSDEGSAKWRLAEAKAAVKIVSDVLEDDAGALVAVVGDLNDEPGSAPLKSLLKAGLVDCHAGLEKEKRITYLRRPYRSTIDYVLVSRAMAELMQGDSARVVEGEPTGSDHAGVVAGFELRDDEH